MINPFKNKKGLGRGLSSLIGDSDIKLSNNKISISSIVPNRNQPRKLFEKYSLEELTCILPFRQVYPNAQRHLKLGLSPHFS